MRRAARNLVASLTGALRSRLFCAIVGFGFGFVWASPGMSYDTARLEAAFGAAQRTQELLLRASRASDEQSQVAALSSALRSYEGAQSALRQAMRPLLYERRRLEAHFARHEEEITALLSVLIRLERLPPSLRALHEDGPEAMLFAQVLIATLLPELQAQAEALRAELALMQEITQAEAEARQQIEAGLRALQAGRVALDAALRNRRASPDRVMRALVDDPALQAGADSLEAVLSLLAQSAWQHRLAQGQRTDFWALEGVLSWPVRGRLIEGFTSERARAGVALSTQQGALVSAPAAGVVVFAGPLRGYDEVIILEPDVGVRLVFAGIGDRFVERGDMIDAGDALGAMPDAPSEQDPLQLQSRQILYLEIRLEGLPVDPLGWYAEEDL